MKYTEVLLVLDASGSMEEKKSDVIGSVNNFVKDLPEDTLITMVVFNSSTHAPNWTIYEHVSKGHFAALDDKTYRPSGMTPLYDAICTSIDKFGMRFSNMAEHERPENIFLIIVTDGLENDSKRYNVLDAKNRITHQQNKYSWKVLYLGANQDAFAEGGNIGVHVDTISNYAATSRGFKKAFSSASFYVNTVSQNKAVENLQEIYNKMDEEEKPKVVVN